MYPTMQRVTMNSNLVTAASNAVASFVVSALKPVEPLIVVSVSTIYRINVVKKKLVGHENIT